MESTTKDDTESVRSPENLKQPTPSEDNNNETIIDIKDPKNQAAEDDNNNNESDNEIVLLRQDPRTKKRVVNKSAYAKLQKSFSNRRSINSIKVKYENLSVEGAENPFKSTLRRSDGLIYDKATKDIIKSKYTTKSLDYPVPKPRRLNSSIPQNKNNINNGNEHNEEKDERHSDSSEPEELISVIVSNTKSRESLDQIQYELDQYIQMDKPKERKRTNSFRRLFSFGSKDKKKKEEKSKSKPIQHDGNRLHCTDNNKQNENNAFNRQNFNYNRQSNNGSIRSNTHHNHYNDDDNSNQLLEEKYAQLYISQFNKAKQAFQQPEEYVDMDKKAGKPNNPTYINVPFVQKYIDGSTSSSNNSSLLLSEKPNNYDNLNYSRFHNTNRDNKRETPPRAQETRLDVKLVSPKQQKTPQLEETYGTVFDSVEKEDNNKRKNNLSLPPKPMISLESSKLKLPSNRDIYTPSPRIKSPIPAHKVSTEKLIATELLKSPKSPKTSRRIYDSPPSQENIDYQDNANQFQGKFNRQPENVNKHSVNRYPESVDQHPEIANVHPENVNKYPEIIDQYPENINNHSANADRNFDNVNNENFNNSDNVKQLNDIRMSPINKPPKPPKLELKKLYIPSPTLQQNPERIVTNAVIHNRKSATPPPLANYNSNHYPINTNNNLLRIRSPSPVRLQNASPQNNITNYYGMNRCATPTNRGPSPGPKPSPQKDEMRRNVEAYCWRELKKMKEQETQDLYSYQMQYGYTEDPEVLYRRGRSASPTTRGSRGRRSLSLPRDPRAQPLVQYVQGASGRTYIMQANPAAIPEGRAILSQVASPDGGSYFVRASPDRRTIDGSSRSLYENYKSNSLYRPIFKRGSLTQQPIEEIQQGNKKVSFINSQVDNGQSWPTRNGFTQSPPQRRIENPPINKNNDNRLLSDDDDVFLPNINNTSQNQQIYYGQTITNGHLGAREPVYVSNKPEHNIYGQSIDFIPVRQPLVRRASISTGEPIYGRQYYQQYAPLRREIIVNDDEIFGRIGAPQRSINDQYSDPRQSQNSLYSSRPIYGKKVAVHNKVCDIYGQIHDNESPYGSTKENPYGQKENIYGRNVENPYGKNECLYGKTENPYGRTNEGSLYGRIGNQGVLIGQLQQNCSPISIRDPVLPPNINGQQFVRNSRLTASANDMYRHYRNAGIDSRYQSDNIAVQNNGTQYTETIAPKRPLPPLPNGKKTAASSDTRTSANERSKTTTNTGKTKKSSFFGKLK